MKKALGTQQKQHLDAVADAWDITQEDAWCHLRKVEVAHRPEDALETHVKVTFQRLFAADHDRVFGEVRGFCREHFHETFTAPKIAGYIESKGIRKRLIVGDKNIIRKLNGTRERHQRKHESFKPCIGLVPRADVDAVLGMLRDPGGGQVVIVDGQAGSGKSTVVAVVADILYKEGWYVAVARMDTHDAATSDSLGKAMGLSESPSVLLAGVSGDKPALFVVDQLDAVSTYSGRNPDNFEAVGEIISEVESVPNVKILLVVRTVDFKEDPRLRCLLHSGGSLGRADSDQHMDSKRHTDQPGSAGYASHHTVGDLKADDVGDRIVANGMRVPKSKSTVELLCRPLNLAVFCRLSKLVRTAEYSTLQDLYRCYTDEIRRKVEQDIGHLDWPLITDSMVRYMSDNEVLTVPEDVLDSAQQRHVNALVSEAVLVRDGQTYAFFHESYFDFLFARSFVNDGRDLCDFLLKSGGHLFQRTQTRQILEHLAATRRDRLVEIAVKVLACDGIRYHLKEVVITLLRTLHQFTTPEDWKALEPLAWSDTPMGSRLLALLIQPGWFDAADRLDRWETWLNDPQTSEIAFQHLGYAARQQRSARAAVLARPFVGVSEEWDHRIRWMIWWVSHCEHVAPEFVDLSVDAIEMGLFDDARDFIGQGSGFELIPQALEKSDPVAAQRLIKAFLRRTLGHDRHDAADDMLKSKLSDSNTEIASDTDDTVSKSTAMMQRPRESQDSASVSPQDQQAIQPMTAEMEDSTVDCDTLGRISDDDWISRIKRCTGDELDKSGDASTDGVREMVRALGSRAQDEPERFAKLALRFDGDISPEAMNEIIRNVADSVDVDLLTGLCEHAHRVYGSKAGRSVCSAISSTGTVNSRLVALLDVYARDEDPTLQTVQAWSAQPWAWVLKDGALLTAGMNTTRGLAALAAAKVLFTTSDHVDALLPVVEALTRDDVHPVRVCAAEAVIALLRHSPERALDLAERMFESDIETLAERTSEMLLTYAITRDPERFSGILNKAMSTDTHAAKRAGRIWAVARWQNQLPSGITIDVSDLPTAARRGAAEAFAANIADSVDDLQGILNDDDPEVQRWVGVAMGRLDQARTSDIDGLITAFIASTAFSDHMRFLFGALERMTTVLPTSVITACERALELVGDEIADPTKAATLTGIPMIPVVLRLYRQGTPDIRDRCLDIIDRIMESNVDRLHSDLLTQLDKAW